MGLLFKKVRARGGAQPMQLTESLKMSLELQRLHFATQTCQFQQDSEGGPELQLTRNTYISIRGGYGEMARYSKKAGEKVEKAMHERKQGTLKSGRSGKKVTSKKQAIAIGLSEAREAGAKVPAKKSSKQRSSKKK